MNCRRVEKLIPLYVGGDLDSHSSEQLALHLEWCGRCNWLADEFRESQSWLRASEPPEFDEVFLTDFKRDVLKEVSNTRRSFLGSFLGSWTQQWNRRQVLALGVASMIICGVLVLYFYQTKGHHSRAVEELAEQTQSDDQNNLSVPVLATDTEEAPGASSKRQRRSRVRHLFSRRTVEPPLVSGADQRSGTSSPDNRLIPGAMFDSREMLRIELQTSDPNIRIIWFAPKEAGSTQNKPATD